eukprot:TRINITY_DN169_c0_g1_i1.p1 TRINITY_DN169_c0_g1~~TRINITY_DN169_c0_g1_i1.p1  ORF type:complete len:467 (-),score=143.47 TRINITY_DN169_c0_g1_i1:241-1641(-)
MARIPLSPTRVSSEKTPNSTTHSNHDTQSSHPQTEIENEESQNMSDHIDQYDSMGESPLKSFIGINHTNSKRKEKMHKCPVPNCNASYTRRFNLKVHCRKVHENVSCPEVFTTLKSTKTGKKWTCPVSSCICGYSRKGDLKFHLLKKHKEISHLFPEICKSKSSKEGKKYLCPHPNCNCGYQRKSDLNTHLATKHNATINHNGEGEEEEEEKYIVDSMDMDAEVTVDNHIDDDEDYDVESESTEVSHDYHHHQHHHQHHQQPSNTFSSSTTSTPSSPLVNYHEFLTQQHKPTPVIKIEQLPTTTTVTTTLYKNSPLSPRHSDQEVDVAQCLASMLESNIAFHHQHHQQHIFPTSQAQHQLIYNNVTTTPITIPSPLRSTHNHNHNHQHLTPYSWHLSPRSDPSSMEDTSTNDESLHNELSTSSDMHTTTNTITNINNINNINRSRSSSLTSSEDHNGNNAVRGTYP